MFNLGHVAVHLRATVEAAPAAVHRGGHRALPRPRGRPRRGTRATGRSPSSPWVAGRVDEATDAARPTRLAEFERLDDRQYHAMTVASLGWAAFVAWRYPVRPRAARSRRSSRSHAMRDLGTTTISLHVGVLVAAMIGRFEDAAEVMRRVRGLVRPLRRPAAGGPELVHRGDDPFEATRAGAHTGGLRGSLRTRTAA